MVADDMMRLSRKLHALAATARIANIPSVVGNVWLGVALGSMAGGNFSQGHAWVIAATLGVIGACLYLAGNFLNDWADRGWDAVHRPERALPQGLFAPRFYLSVAVACGLLGVLSAAALRCQCLVVALVIVACVVLYTRFHKHCAWAVIPMGLCRALLPVLGFVGVAGRDTQAAGLLTALTASAFGLLFHIVGLSLSARIESLAAGPQPRARKSGRFGFAGGAAAMFGAAYLGLSLPLTTCLLGLLPYALWMALCLTCFRRPVSRHVSNLLVGIPLVDWIVLLPLALAQGAHGWSALAATSLWLPPLALVLGKLLQRVAPAT